MLRSNNKSLENRVVSPGEEKERIIPNYVCADHRGRTGNET